MFSNENVAKSCKDYFCEICHYNTSRKSSIDKHYLTAKHTKSMISNQNKPKSCNLFVCQNCDKKYKDNSGLWRHKKTCSQKESIQTEIGKNINPELIVEIIKQNQEFKELLMEQNKTRTEISKKVGINNNNNINSHNKTKFNLNFFLNETCKDAMNITDFVSSIKLQLTDLENVGKNGYVNGISNIIVKNLNALEINKRPVHCSDLKREIMYVKDENKWEKEKEKEKLSKAINKVSYKNVLQISTWQKEHPGCENSHNKENDKYLHIVHESMGASTEEEKKENIDKIITKIAKEVVIEKEAE
jgi:hypothetical protein